MKSTRVRKSSASAKSQRRAKPTHHPKPKARPLNAKKAAKPAFNPKYILKPLVAGETALDQGLALIRTGKSLSASAAIIGVSRDRLLRYGLKAGALRKSGRRWVTKSDRRQRQMPIYSQGKELTITVRGQVTATKIGRYLSAVKQFLATNDRDYLTPFAGEAVRDVGGKTHPFETRPNVLYRLHSAGTEPFEQIYRIVA